MEQVEQLNTFMAAIKLETFVYEHEDCPLASQFINVITNILQHCITNFIISMLLTIIRGLWLLERALVNYIKNKMKKP
jgi:uncharacterized membrane protein